MLTKEINLREILREGLCVSIEFDGSVSSIICLLLTITLALIAVLRFGVRLDLNELLKDRKKKQRFLAQSSCPHMIIEPKDDGTVSVESLFISPAGTTNWICSKCGFARYDQPDKEEINRIANYYLENPEKYVKALDDYKKHATKAL